MCNQVVDPLSNLYDITLRHFSHFWDVESAKELIHLLSNASPSIVAAVECDTVSGCFITVQKLERELEEWAQKHPVQAAFYILDGVLFLQPELLSVPFLGALGFRLIGVEAGSAAATLQRYIGPLMKRSAFSHLQSAAMFGYGRWAVSMATRFAALLAAAFQHFFAE